MNTSDTLRTVPGTRPTLTEHKLLTHPAPATVGLHPTTVFYPLLCTFHTAYTPVFYPSFTSTKRSFLITLFQTTSISTLCTNFSSQYLSLPTVLPIYLLTIPLTKMQDPHQQGFCLFSCVPPTPRTVPGI